MSLLGGIVKGKTVSFIRGFTPPTIPAHLDGEDETWSPNEQGATGEPVWPQRIEQEALLNARALH